MKMIHKSIKYLVILNSTLKMKDNNRKKYCYKFKEKKFKLR